MIIVFLLMIIPIVIVTFSMFRNIEKIKAANSLDSQSILYGHVYKGLRDGLTNNVWVTIYVIITFLIYYFLDKYCNKSFFPVAFFYNIYSWYMVYNLFIHISVSIYSFTEIKHLSTPGFTNPRFYLKVGVSGFIYTVWAYGLLIYFASWVTILIFSIFVLTIFYLGMGDFFQHAGIYGDDKTHRFKRIFGNFFKNIFKWIFNKQGFRSIIHQEFLFSTKHIIKAIPMIKSVYLNRNEI